MRLTLLIPQLIWPEPTDAAAVEGLSCPGLEWLLAHGTLRRHGVEPYENVLGRVFGLGTDAPFGPLRLSGENEDSRGIDAREGFWLCADPVHLRFHHERIILADADAFELAREEAESLAASLNREFSDIGHFHVAGARRWYVRLNDGIPFAAQPLSAVAGRRVDGNLPEEPHSSRIRSWLNEIQMLLHDHPINASRAQAGHPAVNSLWLWGAGTLPASLDTDHDGVWARDPLARGLARTAGIPFHPLPRDLAGLLNHSAPDTAHLAVVDDLLAPVLYEDSRRWRDAITRLEETWFGPLRAALGRQVTAATLLAPTVYGQLAWKAEAADRWKFWRRPRSVAQLATELAR